MSQSLPVFNPSREPWIAKLRLLPSWALTFVSMAVPAAIGLRLWLDDEQRELFQLPYPTAWAAFAALAAALVTWRCGTRPGTFKRQGLPRLWALVVAMFSLSVAVAVASVPQVPGPLHVVIFATCCAAIVLLARLLPLPTLHPLVQWIGIAVLIIGGASTWLAGTWTANYFVAESVDVASALARTLDARANAIRALSSENPWQPNLNPGPVEQRLERVRAALEGVDRDLPGDAAIKRIVFLKSDARQRVVASAEALLAEIDKLAEPPAAAHLISREGVGAKEALFQPSTSYQRRLDARRTYFMSLATLVRAAADSSELRRLAPLFEDAPSKPTWPDRLAAVGSRLDKASASLVGRWPTFWLGRTLSRLPDAPVNAETLLQVALTDGSAPVKLGEIEAWMGMPLGRVKALAAQRLVCRGFLESPSVRASCTPGWYRGRSFYTAACTLDDASGERPRVELTLEYEPSTASSEPEPCVRQTPDQVQTRRSIWPGLGDSVRPARTSLAFAVPKNIDAEAFATGLTDGFEDFTRQRNQVEIGSVQSRGARWSLVYRPRGGRWIRVARTGGGPGVVRFSTESCDSQCW
jgi:hypothetical protein